MNQPNHTVFNRKIKFAFNNFVPFCTKENPRNLSLTSFKWLKNYFILFSSLSRNTAINNRNFPQISDKKGFV